jgi:hypothetical protein
MPLVSFWNIIAVVIKSKVSILSYVTLCRLKYNSILVL